MLLELVVVDTALAKIEISSLELKNIFDSNKSVAILDVREIEELAFSKFEESLHIPLMLLEQNLEQWKEYSRDKDYKVVICRSGIRSLKAAQYLNHYCDKNHLNLSGGINDYAEQIECDIAYY